MSEFSRREHFAPPLSETLSTVKNRIVISWPRAVTAQGAAVTKVIHVSKKNKVLTQHEDGGRKRHVTTRLKKCVVIPVDIISKQI